MSPNFSIVIPTLGNIPELRRLLSSLTKLREIDKAEILLVQNPPPADLLVPFQHEFSDLHLRLLSCAAGVNRARNLGLQEAKGNFILFLDDDCIVTDPNLLRTHQKAHHQNPWAFAVGGFYQNPDSSEIAKAYDDIQKEWLLRNRLYANGECQMLLGGHFSIRKQDQLPLFDEQIVYGGAETEYFFRLKRQGYRFLLISAFVEHSPRLTPALLAKKAVRQGQTHARLTDAGLFLDAPWVLAANRKTSRYKDLYLRFFHRQFLKKNTGSSGLARFRNRLISYHQKVCFYLENRELF